MLLIITLSTFVCITFGVMALYWLVYRPQSAATERLKKMGQAGAQSTATVALDQERPVVEVAERIGADAADAAVFVADGGEAVFALGLDAGEL